MPLTGQFVSRTASFSRDFRATHTRARLTHTPRHGLTFFLARDEIAIDAGDNATPRLASQPGGRPVRQACLTIFLVACTSSPSNPVGRLRNSRLFESNDEPRKNARRYIRLDLFPPEDRSLRLEKLTRRCEHAYAAKFQFLVPESGGEQSIDRDEINFRPRSGKTCLKPAGRRKNGTSPNFQQAPPFLLSFLFLVCLARPETWLYCRRTDDMGANWTTCAVCFHACWRINLYVSRFRNHLSHIQILYSFLFLLLFQVRI